MVICAVAHPVWQVGQVALAVTVTVGVVGQAGLEHGISSVDICSIIHSGIAPQGFRSGQNTALSIWRLLEVQVVDLRISVLGTVVVYEKHETCGL